MSCPLNVMLLKRAFQVLGLLGNKCSRTGAIRVIALGARKKEQRWKRSVQLKLAIPGELARIDRDISYCDGVASAKQAKAKAQKVIKDSASSVAMLETTHRLISKRLAAIQTEKELAIKRAQQMELDAANHYARSVATGDSEGEQTASHDIKKASAMLIECDEHARRQDLIVTALQAEIDGLDAQLTSARKQRDEAQNDSLAATALGFSEEWNRVANQLVVLGSKILAANNKRGVKSWALEGLSIPLFGLRPESSSTTTYSIAQKELA